MIRHGLGQTAGKKPISKTAAFPRSNEFRLRRASELHALKLIFLFVARRDNATTSRTSVTTPSQITLGIDRNNTSPA